MSDANTRRLVARGFYAAHRFLPPWHPARIATHDAWMAAAEVAVDIVLAERDNA